MLSCFVIVQLLFSLVCCVFADRGSQLLILLPEAAEVFGARCLDGSPFGLYYRPASDPAHADDWVIFLQGGGLCITPIDCAARVYSHLGSSKYWAPVRFPSTDITGSSPSVNPYAAYNAIFLEYCSGDTWTGTRTSKVPFDLYFSGHHNLRAVLSLLLTNTSLPAIYHRAFPNTPSPPPPSAVRTLADARRVILSGASAGGIGVLSSADYVDAAIRAAKARRAGVRARALASGAAPSTKDVGLTQLLRDIETEDLPKEFARRAAEDVSTPLTAGAGVLVTHPHGRGSVSQDYVFLSSPIAGYFFPQSVNAYEEWMLGIDEPINKFFVEYVVSAEASYLHPVCVAAKKALGEELAECWDGNVALNYSRVPTFVVENMWDQLMVNDVLLLPPGAPSADGYINYFGSRMRASLGDTRSPPDPAKPGRLSNLRYFSGLFQPSCFQHTSDLCIAGRTNWNGTTYRDVFVPWERSNGTLRAFHQDPCTTYPLCKTVCDHICG
eukprot:TRINITY_DN75_c0_g1_i1.p1 TRINITY_DN75_c0_g1~~TRINITY_DN75_c0_g1_i1.p1  ORF type:complete len:496 (-),score=48.12 TRINITY_DN75_c0_g1_i1:1374-2861(-)